MLILIFIDENASTSVVNHDPTPKIASIHKFRFAVVVLVECWIEAGYCYVNGNTLAQLLTRRILLNVGAWPT